MQQPTRQPKTQRCPTGNYASAGAVDQHGGSLAIYVHLACGQDVVWATSRRTGRKYLANVFRGRSGARFYVGHSIHRCPADQSPKEGTT